MRRVQLGGLVMNCIARGTESIQSNAAWQIPFGLFYFVPTVVALCIWFIPEVSLSPVAEIRPNPADLPRFRTEHGAEI